MNDPVAAYFDKLPETHRRQFEQRASGTNFNFQQRLKLACELGSASPGRLLDCAARTGQITCALPWANFQLEKRLQKWASGQGADAIYLLGAG